jgi:alkylhydroperoxidase family enzyme
VPVIPYIEDPQTEDLKDLYARLSQGGLGLGVLNIFKTMANSPDLMRRWLRMATPLLAPGGLMLDARLREIAILRVAQNARSEYEFAHHVRIAKMAGMTDDEIRGLQNYDDGDLFSELDRAVIRYTDASCALTEDAPDIARELKRWLSDQELLELSFCIGHWGMVARVLVPLEVEVDPQLESELPAEWREWL